MVELSLLCPQDRVEVLSDALDALDALSVSVEDADAQTDAERALFGEPHAAAAGWMGALARVGPVCRTALGG